MAQVQLGGKVVDVDDRGYIRDPAIWDEAVASDLALREERIRELSENHWRVVRYLRGYYIEFQMAPMIRKLCQDTGFTLKQIYELFPSGPARGACKVAGLPKPTGCV
jgi:dissimilatory sulfite reductase related protein